jgi:hypothetical protein
MAISMSGGSAKMITMATSSHTPLQASRILYLLRIFLMVGERSSPSDAATDSPILLGWVVGSIESFMDSLSSNGFEPDSLILDLAHVKLIKTPITITN